MAAGVQKFSAQVIDFAERLSNVADAAEGKHRHGGARVTRWLVLPASGAAAYALLKSDYFSRQAKGIVDDARTRALELPEDLLGRVRQATEGASSPNGSQRRSSARSTKTSAGRRRTSSTRKSS
jgi:hypothetical protein